MYSICGYKYFLRYKLFFVYDQICACTDVCNLTTTAHWCAIFWNVRVVAHWDCLTERALGFEHWQPSGWLSLPYSGGRSKVTILIGKSKASTAKCCTADTFHTEVLSYIKQRPTRQGCDKEFCEETVGGTECSKDSHLFFIYDENLMSWQLLIFQNISKSWLKHRCNFFPDDGLSVTSGVIMMQNNWRSWPWKLHTWKPSSETAMDFI